MSSVRKIDRVWKSKAVIEGAGVHLKRAFGNYEVPRFDPFLLLDDFHSNNPNHYLKGFPGILTVGSKQLPTSCTAGWSMATVWATRGSFPPETSNG